MALMLLFQIQETRSLEIYTVKFNNFLLQMPTQVRYSQKQKTVK